jgi:hypothetical protein
MNYRNLVIAEKYRKSARAWNRALAIVDPSTMSGHEAFRYFNLKLIGSC